MSKLNGVRALAGVQLSRARTAHTQAQAAESLARAHQQAAAAMGHATTGPAEHGANAAIIAALIGVGKGYSTMAGAAHSENRHSFAGARRVVAKETEALTTALARLRALGYKLGS
jgi:hypothetical protein